MCYVLCNCSAFDKRRFVITGFYDSCCRVTLNIVSLITLSTCKSETSKKVTNISKSMGSQNKYMNLLSYESHSGVTSKFTIWK